MINKIKNIKIQNTTQQPNIQQLQQQLLQQQQQIQYLQEQNKNKNKNGFGTILAKDIIDDTLFSLL